MLLVSFSLYFNFTPKTLQQNLKGTIIIGPTIHSKDSDDMIIKFQKEFKSNDNIQERLAYYQCLSEIKNYIN